MTELFAVASGLDPRAVLDAIPPSVRRDLEAAPRPRADGRDIVLDFGAWSGRRPMHHLLPSFSLLTADAYGMRFELAARRDRRWTPWVGTVTLGDAEFTPLPTSADGLSADIDEIVASPSVDAVRLRVRLRAPGGGALLDAPWLATLSAWDGVVTSAPTPPDRVTLPVPPRTQMEAREDIRLRVCSPTSVGMAMQFLGCPLPTMVLADAVFHAPTDRYGVWPAAVRAAAAHGVPGYLLRFADWAAPAWCLARGLPIVASVRYTAGELANAAVSETTGHLIVITGLDGDDVLVNDPAADDVTAVPRRYRRAELGRAWLDRTGVGYVFFRPERAPSFSHH